MITERLLAVRQLMAEEQLDLLLVRSTDRYLNEYVPTAQSTRVWLSGFTGSMGEVVLTKERALLFVDGRYWLQAEAQTEGGPFEVVRVPHKQTLEAAVIEALFELSAGSAQRIGFEPDRLCPTELDRLKAAHEGLDFVPTQPSLVERAWGQARPAEPTGALRAVPLGQSGASVKDKLTQLAEALSAAQLDALYVQRLDEIAWLSNLRGEEIPYQSTFRAQALVTPRELLLALPEGAATPAVEPGVRLVSEAALGAAISGRVGFDPNENTEAGRLQIEGCGARAVRMNSPIGPLKAEKNAAELETMKAAFLKADRVIEAQLAWACAAVMAGEPVSERRFSDALEARFREAGAVGLSFSTIAAAGENGAIIHYSEASEARMLQPGELMLLDCGAYFSDGYATDLTRTFLVGGPQDRGSEEQRRIYTLVLKAAIAGLSAVFPEGTRGSQLDAIVRAPLWAAGMDFAHGTGHGVGINVHEFPPRVAPTSETPLKPGQVFSIEPGLYLPGFGGVRIENLVTVAPVEDKPGFLKIVPLTFSKLDPRLFEPSLLSEAETAWLSAYAQTRAALG